MYTHRIRHPLLSMSGMAPPLPVPTLPMPNVYRVANARPHPQTSRLVTEFGVPNEFIRRCRNQVESAIAVVEGDDWLKATACGPW